MKIARGIAALVILLGLLVGIPAGLIAFGGNPLPTEWSAQAFGQALLRPASDRALIGIVTIVGWIAWAGFAVSVVAELLNALSGRRIVAGRRIHLQLPVIGVGQKFAAMLIVAVITMIAVPHAQPTAEAAPREPTPTAAATATPHIAPGPGTTKSAAPRTTAPKATVREATPAHAPTATAHKASTAAKHQVHVVERGDWLWTLADRYLGDGARWRDIANANPGIDPNRLAIGQKLTIPVPARHHTAADPAPGRSGSERRVAPHAGDTVTVQPGDSLSAISADLYGTEKQWPSIYRENRDAIADPDLIEVGQKIDLPDRKHLEHTDHTIHHQHPTDEPAPPKKAPAPDRLKPADSGTDKTTQTGPGDKVRNEPTPAPPEARPTKPPAPVPVPASARPTTVPAEQPPDRVPSVQQAAPSTQESGDNSAVTTAAGVSVGLLLAAGLVTTINLRRRRQLRSRRPGRRIPAPTPAAAQFEEAVKTQHQPLRVDQLDQVTRSIAAHCHHTGADLPDLSAVRVADHRIDFLFGQPAENPPPGIEVAADGSVWTLHADNLDALLNVDGIDEATPPYPALVTLGRDSDTAHILIDLEAAAALTVAADSQEAAATMLASIALELAVSPWSGDLNLTFVGPLLPGFVDGLDHPAVTHVDDIEPALTSLEARAAAQRDYLDDATVGQKRADPELADAWCPHVVVFGQELTSDQAERLGHIVTDLPRAAIAAVTTNPDLTPWRFELDSSGTGHLSPHDWDLTPQLVTRDQYRHILELICSTGTDDTTPAPWWDHNADQAHDETAERDATITVLPTPDLADRDDTEDIAELDDTNRGQNSVIAAMNPTPRTPLTLHALIGADERAETDTIQPRPTVARAVEDRIDLTQLAPVTTGQPMLRILGEPELVDAKGIPGKRYQQRSLEFLLFLLEHPGASSTRLRTTFCITRDYTKAVISQLRKTLGADPEGNLYLPELGRQPGYRLHDQVTSDWLYVNRLIGRGVNIAPTEALIKVLSMVRGKPLAGAEDWVDIQTLRTDIESTLSDAAHELVDRALDDTDLTLARWATSRGLAASPDSETLLTDRLRTERQAGNKADVERLAGKISANARALGVDLLDETREVLRAAAM